MSLNFYRFLFVFESKNFPSKENVYFHDRKWPGFGIEKWAVLKTLPIIRV